MCVPDIISYPVLLFVSIFRWARLNKLKMDKEKNLEGASR